MHGPEIGRDCATTHMSRNGLHRTQDHNPSRTGVQFSNCMLDGCNMELRIFGTNVAFWLLSVVFYILVCEHRWKTPNSFRGGTS